MRQINFCFVDFQLCLTQLVTMLMENYWNQIRLFIKFSNFDTKNKRVKSNQMYYNVVYYSIFYYFMSFFDLFV